MYQVYFPNYAKVAQVPWKTLLPAHNIITQRKEKQTRSLELHQQFNTDIS
ncbi:hypothetical protein [Nostoc sp. CALU 546]